MDGDSPGHDSVGGVLRLAGWRGHMSTRNAVAVLGLCLVGLAIVWLLTLGAVIALACSLAAFGVIWVSDLPPLRSRGADTFVKIEELNAEDLD